MADEENNEPKKKALFSEFLIFVVAGLVLIGAGLGGGYILFGGSQPDPSDEIESYHRKEKWQRQMPNARLKRKQPSAMKRLSRKHLTSKNLCDDLL